ncbi:uncharacterized protein LOC123006037 isoform X1 [Tribolium madens]|uniref:uncharacterized protein LOC123006037 isoform X1 n=1 Tax=Tribolium madens TaxID=41895 RepID=UPI001CF75B8B|nr:uncharacterized protein LOC123006037 isoform X1 [Tribolium madens]
MQSLEGACEEGEHTIKKIKTSRSSLPLLHHQETSEVLDHCTTPQTFCIFTKILELHREECAKDNNSGNKPGLRRNSHILEKLVARERLNTLILNLYPGNKGYSLAFRTTSRTNQIMDDTANMIETKQWPYDEDELLRYINNEELPPYLTDLIETHYSFLFYNGCVIAEVRDYRQSYPETTCDIHHVLLRPTLKSLLADINNLVDDKVDLGNEERQQLESQILLANKPSLCLDPDNSISSTQSRINHNRQMWNTHRFRHEARKFSQVTVNRKRKLDQFTQRPGLELYDFLTRAKTKSKTGNSVSKSNKKPQNEMKPIPVPNLDPPPIGPPSQGVFINEFKTYQRPKETSDCLPQLIEEYVLETNMPSKEKGKQRVYHIKLSILQRPSNSEYLGELYLDRDHKKNERNGVACRFSLGSRANANRYIHQFTEIFTESGRKSVRIWYGLSPGYKERVAMAQAQAQAQNAAQTNLAQQHLTQLSQTLQNQSCVTSPLVNGTVGSRISLVQQNQSIQNTSTVPILQSHLQGTTQIKSTSQVSNEELATKLMNIDQQIHAAVNAKQQQQQQQQKLTSNRGNTAIINLLNSSPASNINSDASAAVVNAINNSSLSPQQVQTINQKLLARKMTLSNVANARVLNHSNLIAVNNNRMNISELNSQLSQPQSQTITLTSMNSGGTYTNYTTVPIKQQVSDNNKSALSALLVGTPAADRPDIVGPNTSSLLLEKLGGSPGTSTSNTTQNSTHFIQSLKSGLQYMVQSPPKANTVVSPLSSPPSQNTNTINLAQLQSLSGLQNVQVQLLSLNVSSTGNLQGHPTSLLVSLPVSTSTSSANTVTQTANMGSGVNSLGVGGPTVVLANAGTSNIAQLVTSGVKGLTQQGIRAQGPASVSLSQGGQSYQLVTPLQRPRMQQNIQRTPITLKMATQNSNAATTASITSQLQKQAQFQQYQQLCLNQQQKNVASVAGKLRRRSNTSDPQ